MLVQWEGWPPWEPHATWEPQDSPEAPLQVSAA